jgi:hypothetical protein
MKKRKEEDQNFNVFNFDLDGVNKVNILQKEHVRNSLYLPDT